MNPDEPFHEIGKLLRSRKPDPQPSPGLELRILRAVNQPPRPAKARLWPWLLIPPAVAMALVLMGPEPAATPAPASPQAAAPPVQEMPVPPESGVSLAIHEINPLHQETRALRRDAGRAGRFLIDCLPSFSAVPHQ